MYNWYEMRSKQPAMFLVFILAINMVWCTRAAVSGQVHVVCSNSTLDNDLSICWRQGVSVVCNSLDEGVREAARLGTSLLVENISSCTTESGLRGEMINSNLSISVSSAQLNSSVLDSEIRGYNQTIGHFLDQKLQQRGSSGINIFPTSACPPGFIPSEGGPFYINQTSCKCFDGIRGIVQCDNVGGIASAFIQDKFCMSQDKTSADLYIALCVFSCSTAGSLLDGHTAFNKLPDSASHLETIMCNKANRRGYLCSECQPGYKPSAYSYSPKCVPCDLSRAELAQNWMKYLALAVLPQSILFLLMAVLRVSVTAPPFSSMIHAFQAIATPQYLHRVMKFSTCGTCSHNAAFVLLVRLLIIFYGFFNLDFFRNISPELCLNLDVTQLLLLEYLLAFWPLVLIIGAYLLIKLHTGGFKPIVWVWKPVRYCLGHHRHEWHLKSSLIETFASFLLLSWIKLLSISSRLLDPICVFTVKSDGNVSEDCSHLGTSPNMRLFSDEHLQYGIVAVTVVAVFVFIPLFLLLLYPLKIFHRFLNWCGYRSQALHVFMDSFQGSCRNGTNGTTDCRWFAPGHLLILRIFCFALGSVFKTGYFFPTLSIILIGIAIMVYAIQPYKKSIHNTFESTLMLILAAFYASHGAIIAAEYVSEDGYLSPSLGLTFALGVLPLVVSVSYATWWIVKLKLSGAQLFPRVRQWWWQRRAEFEESMPDRLNNPQDYQNMELASIIYEAFP